MGAPRTRQVADLLLVFVAEQRPTTLSVAEHFGWNLQRARRELQELADVGLVEGAAERQQHGSMHRWRMT